MGCNADNEAPCGCAVSMRVQPDFGKQNKKSCLTSDIFVRPSRLYTAGLCNGCNMAMGDLPDMYARSPRAGGIHIRQITNGHVTTIMYHFVPIVTTPVV